jgi:hypothetical protein
MCQRRCLIFKAKERIGLHLVEQNNKNQKKNRKDAEGKHRVRFEGDRLKDFFKEIEGNRFKTGLSDYKATLRPDIRMASIQ